MGLCVTAELGYLAPMKERPISHSGYPELENLLYQPRRVAIHAARPVSPTLATHGFAAWRHASDLTGYGMSDAWHDCFKREVVALVREHTGAREVVVAVASYRSTALGGSQGAARFCHNDYTPGSTARHITALDPAQADRRLAGRFAAYNLWRLVSPPPQAMPLALCDARSVAAADFVPGEARYGPAEDSHVWGEIACFRYNPQHRWFYYPDLGNEETLIWCGYDSDPAYPSIVPHTAFEDPDLGPETPPRINVEARCYAFF